MTTGPDPQIVRKVARSAMTLAAQRRDDIDRAILRHGGLGDRPERDEELREYRTAYGALYAAVRAEMHAATIAVSWPDERDGAPDESFAMIAEDAPVGPARSVAEHWRGYAATISDSVKSPMWAAVADVTANILDAMDAEQDQQSSDVRAVAALLAADGEDASEADFAVARTALRSRFADRIAALEDRT